MYNMEIYCTRPYCIENLYWTRRLWRLVQYGFSIQYLSIVYITLYNNLLVLPVLLDKEYWSFRYCVLYNTSITSIAG
jgi:hypothetical protein